MKLYLTAAGVYAGTQVEAKADGKGWTPEEVPTDKQGLIDYLNALKHSATINEVNPMEGQPEPSEVNAPPPSRVSQLVAFDDEFERMPIARQLHYAARAMENAREVLP